MSNRQHALARQVGPDSREDASSGPLEVPCSVVLDSQSRALTVMRQLLRDDELAEICLKIYFAARPVGERPSFDSVCALARHTWTRLTSHLLKMATPYGWDTDAARWVEHVSRDIAGERCLSARSLTSSRGWWWFGQGALTAFGNVCAIAWEADDDGIDVYPLELLTGVRGPGTGCESERYSIGPVAFTGFRIEFGLPLDEYEREWRSLPEPLRTLMIGFVRFLITTGAAMTNGSLVAHAVRVPRYARPEFVRRSKVQPFAPTVHVIRLPTGTSRSYGADHGSPVGAPGARVKQPRAQWRKKSF